MLSCITYSDDNFSFSPLFNFIYIYIYICIDRHYLEILSYLFSGQPNYGCVH